MLSSKCPASGREALGVAGKQRGLSDVVQAAEEHHHALQAHAKAAMRRRAVLERIYVRLNALQWDLMHLRPLCRSRQTSPCQNTTHRLPKPCSLLVRVQGYGNGEMVTASLRGKRGQNTILQSPKKILSVEGWQQGGNSRTKPEEQLNSHKIAG